MCDFGFSLWDREQDWFLLALRVGVGDSYNQHRGAYTVDEQKQLLGRKKKKGKYIILCLETDM